MGGNAFYSNAEAYAFEILQQKLIKEAQRSAQHAFMEFSALKSLFNQGQFIYCIPFGGLGFSNNVFPLCPTPPPLCPPDIAFSPDPQHALAPPPPLASPALAPPPPLASPALAPPPPLAPPALAPPPLPPPPPQTPAPSPPSPTHHPPNHQSTVHVNVRTAQPKIANVKPGSDECILGEMGIDVTIDLREYLPAEISLDVEERTLEVKASHVDARGSKTFARRYDLPACIILDSVKCVLSHEGFLLISAAWVKME